MYLLLLEFIILIEFLNIKYLVGFYNFLLGNVSCQFKKNNKKA